MILKLENETYGYDMWDDLAHVTFHRANMEVELGDALAEPTPRFKKQVALHPIQYEEAFPDHVITDAFSPDGKRTRKSSHGWLLESHRNGKPFSVFFDMKGFLLNEKGQTVESFR